MLLRRAVISDIDLICRVMEKSIGSYNADHYSLSDKDYFTEIIESNGITLVAEKKGNIVAYAVLSFDVSDDVAIIQKIGISPSEISRTACLDACEVSEKSRGNGLQKAFIVEREQIAKAAGYKHLYVSVHPENKFSLNNMLDAGFVIRNTALNTKGKIRHYLYKGI